MMEESFTFRYATFYNFSRVCLSFLMEKTEENHRFSNKDLWFLMGDIAFPDVLDQYCKYFTDDTSLYSYEININKDSQGCIQYIHENLDRQNKLLYELKHNIRKDNVDKTTVHHFYDYMYNIIEVPMFEIILTQLLHTEKYMTLKEYAILTGDEHKNARKIIFQTYLLLDAKWNGDRKRRAYYW